MILAATALGGDFGYQICQAADNHYVQLAGQAVPASHAFAKLTAGQVPVFVLAFFGTHNDLRGYPAGLYVDKMMIDTQREYRWRFKGDCRMLWSGWNTGCCVTLPWAPHTTGPP